MTRLALVPLSIAILVVGSSAVPRSLAQSQEAPAAPQRVTDRLRDGAAALTPLVRADVAKEFLAATSKLTEPSTRTIYRKLEADREG